MTMFVTTSATPNNNQPPSYIVAATTATAPTTPTATTATTGSIDATSSSTAPQILSDIQLICMQRKKKTKRHIYLTFVESRPLSCPTDEPSIQIIRKSNTPTQSIISYALQDSISYEYFDTVKNDFHSFIYVYFESFTISIFFSEDNIDKKPIIIKHLEYMSQSKDDKSSKADLNASQDPSQSQSTTSQQPQQSQQGAILPCTSTTENVIHTFDINLIPNEPIINRNHVLVGPSRLYFTTTDLYIASIHCNRKDLKVTISNQCPAKDKAILCIPYFTIKNYGNRSNIFLIELGKSNYGNGEIHMKCQSSSLASTIHLLVSPVIEERPLILSSAFQNQLLTNKRIEKSKNIHPPIQLTTDTSQQPITDSPFSFLKKKAVQSSNSDSDTSTTMTATNTTTKPNEIKSHFVRGFIRTISKNVTNLRRSATFHHGSMNNSHNNNSEQLLSTTNDMIGKNKSVAFKIDENKLYNDQHQIILPERQKNHDSTLSVSSTMTKRTSETMLTSTSTSTINTNRLESTMGTYIDMGLALPRSDVTLQHESQDDITVKETTATAEIGVNTSISLSPFVRSAIIVGNSVHLIADDNTLFPIGPRSFTSPASVMQPFKTQLTGQSLTNDPGASSSDLIGSSPNSSNSLQQTSSVTNSQKSLLLSYGIVTFNNNDFMTNDQSELATSPPPDGITIDHRLNSDLSLMSMSQPQQQGSGFHPLDSISSASSATIFHTLSMSTSNVGDTASSHLRTPRGSILFCDEQFNDQLTTYLLGPPQKINEDTLSTNMSCLSSFNLATSISRAQLSNIDEEKAPTHDSYAFVEPLVNENLCHSTLLINENNILPTPEKSINYADILLPTHSTNEHSDNNEQQQTNTIEDLSTDGNDFEDEEYENNERSTTKLYADIDFQQTQRYDRIVQSAAKAKLDDQAPPFVL